MKKLIPIILVLLFACEREQTAGMSTMTPPAAPTSPVAAPKRVVESAQNPAGVSADAVGVEAAPTAATAPVPVQTQSAMPRMIVRTADVRIVVGDTSKSVEAITEAAEAAGGYVSGSNIWREGELLRAKLTLRVPADKLTSTLAAIRGMARRVENETINSEDVSQEFVDLESQLRNLQAAEAELRELLKVARKNSQSASEILEVYAQLVSIRAQIEQTQGRMRYLSQVTALSAINVEMVPDAIAQPVVEPGWRPAVIARDASRALVVLMQHFATGIIWFAVYLLPILGILLGITTALWKLAKRSRTREA